MSTQPDKVKITPAQMEYIIGVVETARSIGITNVIIEPGRVRAMDAANTVTILQTSGVVDLACGSIGITRPDVLQARVNIATDVGSAAVEATTATYVQDKKEIPFARALAIKGAGFKIDFRCSNPQIIKAPKALPNSTAAFEFDFDPLFVQQLSKGRDAMGADSVVLFGEDTGVYFTMKDVSGDEYTNSVVKDVVGVAVGSQPSFDYKYPIKTLLSMLKKNRTYHIAITEQGLLSLVIDGLTVYLLREV